MGRKTNSKRSKLIALFAVILAAVGALVLMPKPAMAEGPGKLTIKKQSNAESLGNEKFEFSVTLPTVGEQDPYRINAPGKTNEPFTSTVTFQLAKDDVATITGINVTGEGSSFTVTETPNEGSKSKVTYVKYTAGEDDPIFSDQASYTGTITAGKPTGTLEFWNNVPDINTEVSPKEITPTSEDYKETINDNVTVSGLVPNKEYSVEDKLMQGDEAVSTATAKGTTDKYGNLGITVEHKDFAAGQYAGKKLVAYATIKDGDKAVAVHESPEDTKQTVTINEIPPIGSLSITKTLKTPIIDGHIENPTGDTDEEKAADKKKWETRKEKAQNQLGENKAVFLFKVDLTGADGKTLEGEFKYTGAAEGTLKSGDSIGIPVTKIDEAATITIEGLPEGTTYTVAETPAEGYVLKDNKSDTGDIEKGKTSAADFTNAPLGSLKIIKNIKITAFDAELELYNKAIEEAQKEMDASTDQSQRDAYQIIIDEANKYKDELEKKKAELAATEFTFTVTLTDADKKALTETKEYKTVTTNGETGTEGTIKFEDGKSATVKLKGGEYITVIGMDPEYNVSVAETPVDGWTANHKSLSGTVIEGVPLTATFENTYDGTDTTTPTSNTPSSGSTTKSSTKLANTADPVVDAVLIAAAGAPVALSGLALRRRK